MPLHNRSMQVFFAGAFGVFACGSIASWVRTYFFGVAAHRVAQRLRSSLFAALMQQDVAFFDEQRSGELVTILMEVRLNSFVSNRAQTVVLSAQIPVFTLQQVGIDA
jgi:ABC-type multidrug transport system fused ATPase/permease subunit